MYRCYNPKKLRFLLVIDAVILTIWMLCSAAVKAWQEPPEGIFLPVIMYHSITDSANGDYQISPALFEQDLRYLKSQGYETVSVADLVAYTEGTASLPKHPILLTFDDGFYNNLSAALPLLERYDMCAVVSIVGEYTEIRAANDPHVERYSYLTWEDVNELLSSGRIELGNHTWNLHSNNERAGCSIMYGEDTESYSAMLRDDLNRVQEKATEKTGCTPTVFAYPYGFICRESIPVLKELGFVCTLTCYEKPNYITHDKDCLYGLFRYNRPPGLTPEAFFTRALSEEME